MAFKVIEGEVAVFTSLKKIILICLIFPLVRCSVHVLPPKVIKESKPFTRAVEFQYPLEAKWLKKPSQKIRMFLKGENIHQYRAQFEFLEDLGPLELWVNEALVEKVDAHSVSDIELFLKDDETYSIFFKKLKPAKVTEKKEDSEIFSLKGESSQGEKSAISVVDAWEIKTPKDVELNSEIIQTLVKSSTEDPLRISASRVYFTKKGHDSPIFTEGKSFVISADEIFSENIQIETFPQKTKGAIDQNGRSGGTLTIKAKSAQGKMHLVLRGEDGGDGGPGEAYTERGEKGADAMAIRLLSSAGNLGHHAKRVCLGSANGGKGAKGKEGRKGHDGGRGGNSGSFILEIANPSPDFEVSMEKIVGHGGNEGPGGPGQLGGLGGLPVEKSICKWARVGEDGETGVPGEKGRPGLDGQPEGHCIHIGEGFGQC